MPLIFACIAPHGSIPGLEGADQCAQTTAAMEEVGRRLAAARPETVVVVTPRSMRIHGALARALSEWVWQSTTYYDLWGVPQSLDSFPVN